MRSMSKSLTQWLLAVAGEYARARNLSMSSVGFYAVRDAKFLSTDDLGNLVRPGFSLAKLDQAITWFSERWPAGARWPDPPAWPYPIPTTEPGEPNGKASIEGAEGGPQGKKGQGGPKAKGRRKSGGARRQPGR